MTDLTNIKIQKMDELQILENEITEITTSYNNKTDELKQLETNNIKIRNELDELGKTLYLKRKNYMYQSCINNYIKYCDDNSIDISTLPFTGEENTIAQEFILLVNRIHYDKLIKLSLSYPQVIDYDLWQTNSYIDLHNPCFIENDIYDCIGSFLE
jgi:hypothetical protein